MSRGKFFDNGSSFHNYENSKLIMQSRYLLQETLLHGIELKKRGNLPCTLKLTVLQGLHGGLARCDHSWRLRSFEESPYNFLSILEVASNEKKN